MNLVHWPEIVQFHQLRKSIEKYPEMLNGNTKVKYRGKIKLDGSNMAINLKFNAKSGGNIEIIPQSREQLLIDGKDCYGFVNWLDKDHWKRKTKELMNLTYSSHDLQCSLEDFDGFTIFGEFCGTGLQNRCSISSIGKKIFAIFAAQPIGSNHLITDPSMLEHTFTFTFEKQSNVMLSGWKKIEGVYVLPWYTDEIEIDWSSDLTDVVNKLNLMVEEVEKCDPWVKETFGVEGLGEGIVFYPVSDHCNSNEKYKNTKETFANIGFKCKGEKHKTVNNKKPVQIDAEKAANAEAFAKLVLAEARLEQGSKAVNNGELKFDNKNIGNFLRWIETDVQKECQTELAESNMIWKDVAKVVGTYARNWYLTKLKEV